METKNKNLLNVTDLSSYLYCPRKFFLQKIKGLREPPNKAMIEGKLKHQVREIFSNNEKDIVIEIKEQKTKQQIIELYNNLIEEIIQYILSKEKELIKNFFISEKDIANQIRESMKNEFELRAESILNTIKQGYFEKDLWENLSPKYISEFFLESEKIGIKGRIDRLMFSETEIIPFELKTRTAEKVYESDEIQLTAYAMLLEEAYKQEIPIGIIESGNIKHEIKILEQTRQKVLNLVKEINLILQASQKANPKYPSNFSKCQSCSWNKECEEI